MRFITTTLLIFFSLSSFGQIQKGNFMVGGNGSFTNQRSSSGSSTSAYLLPSAGIFMTDHLAVGLGVPVSFYKFSSSTSYGVGISPFVRYYFLKKEKSSLFVPLNVALSSSTYSSSNSSSKTIYTYTSGSLGIGYTYFFHPSIGLESTLSYFLRKTTNNIMAESTSNSNGINLFVGLQVYLSRKSE